MADKRLKIQYPTSQALQSCWPRIAVAINELQINLNADLVKIARQWRVGSVGQ